jgi:hypothetical protein
MDASLNRLASDAARGAAAGFAATLPMSAVMHAGHQRLPWGQRGPLPPAKITGRLLESVDAADIEPETGTALTLANHFAYGTATGALFGAVVGSRAAMPVAAGVAYALGVWAGSYLVWLPAAGLHRSATREPASRNLLMLAAHVVWGASLGAAMSRRSARL